MNWQKGRQKATESIRKLTLWSFWRTDGYILNMPQGTTVGWHTDPVFKGTNPKHFRLNITLWGSWVLCRKRVGERQTIYTNQRMFSFHLFRPDITEHKVDTKKNSYVLSIGFVI